MRRRSITQQSKQQQMLSQFKRASFILSRNILNKIENNFQVKEPSPQNLFSLMSSKISPNNTSKQIQDPSINEENLKLAELKKQIKANSALSEKRLTNRRNKYKEQQKESDQDQKKQPMVKINQTYDNLFKYTQVDENAKKMEDEVQKDKAQEVEDLSILSNPNKFINTKTVYSNNQFQKQLNKLDKQIQVLNSKAQNFFKSEKFAANYQTIQDFRFQLYNESKLNNFSTKISVCDSRSKSQATNRHTRGLSSRGSLPSVQSQRTIRARSERQRFQESDYTKTTLESVHEIRTGKILPKYQNYPIKQEKEEKRGKSREILRKESTLNQTFDHQRASSSSKPHRKQNDTSTYDVMHDFSTIDFKYDRFINNTVNKYSQRLKSLIKNI